MKEKKKITHVILLITLLILLAYSNTFQSSWQFDDEPNILLNTNLHISELTFEQINRAMRAHPSSPEDNKLYRPLPCLSFGLNWYLGKDNVFGYHLVNIALHILTASLLFLTLRLLLHIYYRKKKNLQLIYTAALLSTFFWALAPIQTQAVTYIVQRMASMAAMFGIAAIYAYLRGRNADNGKQKIFWFFLCLLLFFAALGSKENAFLLLPSLMLIEFAFFRHHITKKQRISLIISVSFILIAAALFVRYGLGHSPSFLAGYDTRSFTFTERILTEPRILLMYLSQIFLPLADRLSFEHELILSTSLFSPWTTLPAIAIILSLIGGSLVFLKKHPPICFPILFYFLNHAIESTIFPLELVFEHRNYLPSLFLFLPFGVLIARILYGIPCKPTCYKITTATCTTLFLFISGQATYTRNMAWATEGTLWTDAIKKAPNSARAARYLGKWYQQLGQHEIAYRYLQFSLKNYKNDPSPEYARKTSLNQIGSLHYDRHENKKALYYFNKCLDSDQYSTSCLRNRVLVFLRLNQPKDALRDAEILIEQYPSSVAYRYLSALASYQAENFDAALKMLKSVKNPFNDQQVMQLAGLIFLKKNDYKNGLFFLKRAVQLFPSLENKINLSIAYKLSSRPDLFEKTAYIIFNNYSKEKINRVLTENRDNIFTDSMIKQLNVEFAKFAESVPK
ncbi:MAG: tetratricopeptide repeat protein [Candidatus Electrothrix sp. AW1]|nr:tetratricopeptide repeat protein [Candidatus Electrothrix sp. AX1]MCI5181660.1 tetratricopeptide repeat protein [Candidatus Electrothrix gigas]